MDSLLEKLLTTGGPASVVVIVVWIFVKDRKDMTRDYRMWMGQMIAENRAWIEKMHTDHLTAREETRECLQKNTVSMNHNTEAVNRLAEVVSRCNLGGGGHSQRV